MPGTQAGRADRAVDACAQLSDFAAAVDLARAHAPPVRGPPLTGRVLAMGSQPCLNIGRQAPNAPRVLVLVT